MSGFDVAELGEPIPEDQVLMFYPRRSPVSGQGTLSEDAEVSHMSAIREYEESTNGEALDSEASGSLVSEELATGEVNR